MNEQQFETSTIKHQIIHWFEYRGITCEIAESESVLPEYWPKGWTYYIYLRPDRFEDAELGRSVWLRAKPLARTERKHFDYYRNEFLSSLEFHGGITYYSQEIVGGVRAIRVGCDYQHLWDDGRTYRLDDLVRDAKATVDDLHKRCSYFFWCHGNGKLYHESEGVYIQGNFHSNEYLAEQQQEAAERTKPT